MNLLITPGWSSPVEQSGVVNITQTFEQVLQPVNIVGNQTVPQWPSQTSQSAPLAVGLTSQSL